ncbi:Flp pilus assembly protein TadB [Kineococcus xinjiangensis]|uniref:Flp pilus assembly protein TadB n=1 Tax=Kineococcus xinjiangensis TaxID=512762 RepID=A0A2S6IWQ0_9ACTN|nr:type II secretion system F family protein [Kineococcus xinjiangensis]PPK98782.1 Flp pilus assembly protein TadB [Kineococcus xinjiangensis]
MSSASALLPAGLPVPAELLAVVPGALAGAGVLVAVLAATGVPRRDAARPSLLRRSGSGTPWRRRWVRALVVGLLALVLTRWVVAGVGLALLAASWDKLLGGGADEGRGIARLEALASWTESLRDTIAGAVGLEQAIPATAPTAAPALRPSLNLLVDRLRIREPLPEALLAFADDVDDPSADVVCAALVLNARLRGPGLRDVLTALAVSTREELDMRRRVEASRRSIRRSVRIVLLIVLGVMGGLAVFNGAYVAPYAGLTGQLVLAVVALLLVAGVWWLRRLSAPPRTERFLAGAAGALLPQGMRAPVEAGA